LWFAEYEESLNRETVEAIRLNLQEEAQGQSEITSALFVIIASDTLLVRNYV